MHRPSRPASARRLRVAALAAAPVVVALAVPASAAPAVGVTPAPEGCGVVVALTGLSAGAHTAVVRTTVLDTGDPVPVVVPADAPPSPAAEPVLAAERAVSGDGEVVVVLDATAVPDADPRVAVAVTLDGDASPAVELALPGCAAPPTPTPTPTTEPTTPPAPTPTTPPTTAPEPTLPPPTEEPATTPPAVPAPDPVPSVTDLPSVPSPSAPLPAVPTPSAPLPSASPSGTPVSPSPSAAPTTTPAPRPTSSPSGPTATDSPVRPVQPSPVMTGAPVPSPVPTLDAVLDRAYGSFELGTGSSGYLSLMSFTAAPQLDTAAATTPVPAPVIAAPEGSAAGVVAGPQPTGTPLEDLLPQAPADDADEPVTAQLAAPDLATDAVADPLVDLAPAAFVLSASLGGLLMAGRRRAG